MEHSVAPDAVAVPIEAAEAPAGADAASSLSRLVLPPVVYCVTADEAANAVEAVVRDAMGRPIGLDIETAASPAEQARLKELTLSLATAKGKLAALKKAKASTLDIKTAARDAKALHAHRKMAEQAALDPHRASIRLVQLYGGGDKAYVVDIARTGHGAFEAAQWPKYRRAQCAIRTGASGAGRRRTRQDSLHPAGRTAAPW